MTDYELISIIISAASATCAGIAVLLSIANTQKQAALQKEVHQNERILAQRQSFIDIWPHISTLNDIDPDAPIEVDVVKAVNALELVALCWESEVVDRDVIRRAFADQFLQMYTKISKTKKMPNGKTGEELITNSPATERLESLLREERRERGKVGPIRTNNS